MAEMETRVCLMDFELEKGDYVSLHLKMVQHDYDFRLNATGIIASMFYGTLFFYCLLCILRIENPKFIDFINFSEFIKQL